MRIRTHPDQINRSRNPFPVTTNATKLRNTLDGWDDLSVESRANDCPVPEQQESTAVHITAAVRLMKPM